MPTGAEDAVADMLGDDGVLGAGVEQVKVGDEDEAMPDASVRASTTSELFDPYPNTASEAPRTPTIIKITTSGDDAEGEWQIVSSKRLTGKKGTGKKNTGKKMERSKKRTAANP